MLEVQNTPDSVPDTAPVGVGTVCTAQDVPFHRSAKGTFWLLLFTYQPTPVQALEAVHDTDGN
jgi:hypothetical protein